MMGASAASETSAEALIQEPKLSIPCLLVGTMFLLIFVFYYSFLVFFVVVLFLLFLYLLLLLLFLFIPTIVTVFGSGILFATRVPHIEVVTLALPYRLQDVELSMQALGSRFRRYH